MDCRALVGEAWWRSTSAFLILRPAILQSLNLYYSAKNLQRCIIFSGTEIYCFQAPL